MAKPIKAIIKVHIEGGAARPAPPLGPALAQHGIPIMDFCKKFNDVTQDRKGDIIPTVIRVYHDNSFDFDLKTTPAALLIKRALGIEKGSGVPNKEKVGKLTKDQLRQIAEHKMKDLNANDVEQAMKIIAGTARSMGVEVEL